MDIPAESALLCSLCASSCAMPYQTHEIAEATTPREATTQKATHLRARTAAEHRELADGCTDAAVAWVEEPARPDAR